MFNKIFVLGRFTKDPEVNYSKDGSISYCTFNLAVNRKVHGEDHATFFNCKAFKKTAEIVSKFGKKGQLCLAEGEMRQSNYTSKDGQKKVWTEVILSSFHSFGKELKAEDNILVNNISQEVVGNEFVDDNIPF
jgi:single-strand DNA-binding protein